PLIYKVSEVRVRLASRKATPASVLADFDAGMARLLALFDATDEQTLITQAKSLGETRTIAGMFQVPVSHFAEHAADVRKGPGSSYPVPDKKHAINAKARASQQVKKGHLTKSQASKISAKANKVIKKGKS